FRIGAVNLDGDRCVVRVKGDLAAGARVAAQQAIDVDELGKAEIGALLAADGAEDGVADVLHGSEDDGPSGHKGGKPRCVAGCGHETPSRMTCALRMTGVDRRPAGLTSLPSVGSNRLEYTDGENSAREMMQ